MKQPQYNTALYMRLSRDDETFGDSVSIETQRTVLTQFVREHPEFHVVSEFVDDGWSGTNFDRPQFKRMMEEIETGNINCVITKDLSRFGREHIMMGYYLEFVFPKLKVRYIAVNDNEDTDRGLSDFVPFKNLINEFMAKDTSRKIKGAFRAKFLNGERVNAMAPFGYQKHPEIKNKLMIDEETAWIVRKIFDLAFHGLGVRRIANTLMDEKVPCPGWFQYTRNGGCARFFEGQPEEKRYVWSQAYLKNILKDETYIGNTIHNRWGTVSYKNKRMIRNPDEKCLRIEGTHEAIIEADIFEAVQKQIASRRRVSKNKTMQIFSGLLKCADCGWAMRYCARTGKRNPYAHYMCGKYKDFQTRGCTTHYIRYDALYAYVLARIQHWSARAIQDEDALLRQLLSTGDRERNAAQKKQTAELKKARKRKAEVDGLFAKLYEDWAAGRITEYNFNMLTAKYQAEQIELEEKIDTLTAELDAVKQMESDARNWIDLIRQYANPTELTAPLLNALIEKILIHQSVKGEDGEQEQEIEIFYRFIGKID